MSISSSSLLPPSRSRGRGRDRSGRAPEANDSGSSSNNDLNDAVVEAADVSNDGSGADPATSSSSSSSSSTSSNAFLGSHSLMLYNSHNIQQRQQALQQFESMANLINNSNHNNMSMEVTPSLSSSLPETIVEDSNFLSQRNLLYNTATTLSSCPIHPLYSDLQLPSSSSSASGSSSSSFSITSSLASLSIASKVIPTCSCGRNTLDFLAAASGSSSSSKQQQLLDPFFSASSSSSSTSSTTSSLSYSSILPSFLEVGSSASWSLSSAKSGNGVHCLRDSNLDSFWQSDGAAPHIITLSWNTKQLLSGVSLYVDYKQDESYTPNKIEIKAGITEEECERIGEVVELNEPTGWINIRLKQPLIEEEEKEGYSNGKEEEEKGGGGDGKGGKDRMGMPLRCFVLQLLILGSHQNGRDTHVRQVRVWAPKLSTQYGVKMRGGVAPGGNVMRRKENKKKEKGRERVKGKEEVVKIDQEVLDFIKPNPHTYVESFSTIQFQSLAQIR